jgi:hypothetical protein
VHRLAKVDPAQGGTRHRLARHSSMSPTKAQLLVFEFIYCDDSRQRFRVCDMYLRIPRLPEHLKATHNINTFSPHIPNVYNGSYQHKFDPRISTQALFFRMRLLRIIMQHAPPSHHNHHRRRMHHHQRNPLLALRPLAQEQDRETRSRHAAPARRNERRLAIVDREYDKTRDYIRCTASL